MSKECIICHLSGDPEEFVKLSAKGLSSLHVAAKSRGEEDKILHLNLQSPIHERCRKNYVSKQKIERWNACQENISCKQVKRTRSFDTQAPSSCLFCDCTVKVDTQDFSVVVNETTHTSFVNVCNNRKDNWASEVLCRLQSCKNLVSNRAMYHRACLINFRNGKSKPSWFNTPEEDMNQNKPKKGRPQDYERSECFNEVTKLLEQEQDNEDTTFTISCLCDMMKEKGCDPYDKTYMKKKLLEKYKNDIVIHSSPGMDDVVVLARSAKKIITEFHANQKRSDVEQEKLRIIEAAASFIKNDIKLINQRADEYKILDKIESYEQLLEYIPVSLQVFLNKILQAKCSQNKIATIGHTLIQASRPRSILTPLQIALAVQLHHSFGSKSLIEHLHQLGFCASYKEVAKLERSAATLSNTKLDVGPNSVVHHVADNADHDTCTLDGNGTFHGMAIIAAITPAPKKTYLVIPRREVTDEDIRKAGEIEIKSYMIDKSVLSTIKFRVNDFTKVEDLSKNLDLLWFSSWHLHIPRPGWQGAMQAGMCGKHPGKTNVFFLPMIDLSASSDSCVYSTLDFIGTQGKLYNYTPMVTFDQQLWWKAMMIIENASLDCPTRGIVYLLGGFHTIMSFVGSIGHIMDGSGLRDVLELMYASNTVPHLLSGKAITRAIRAHVIIESALFVELNRNIFLDNDENEDDSDKASPIAECGNQETNAVHENSLTKEEMKEVNDLFSRMISGTLSDGYKEVMESPALKKIQQLVDKNLVEKSKSKTGQLWIQYMDMVRLLRQFIKAERTGNWLLHLQSLRDMMPYFAAAGHNNYLKSSCLYIQKMRALEVTHPNVYKMFLEGFHVVRRSHRFWAGLSLDFLIETTFMRTMKSLGGFTRRTGITDLQRLVWVMSRPICTLINSLLTDLTKIQQTTSDQHKECGNSRLKRDVKDTSLVIDYLKKSSPFQGDDNMLRCIATGVSAAENVNAHIAKAVGECIVTKMNGKTVAEFVPRRAEQVVLMSAKSSSHGEDKHRCVDPALLFQRLITVAKRSDKEEESYFKYELCSYPTALFDNNGLLRSADKPELAYAIATMTTYDPMKNISGVLGDKQTFVLDGGSLLHRIPWVKNETYASIYEKYWKYICSKYGNRATVVFDGYGQPSTKDITHLKRLKSVGKEVFFTTTMKLTTSKEEFLSSTKNKAKFIEQLGQFLSEKGCDVMYADGDADVLIIQQTIINADKCNTILIGDDTDLLILLLHYANEKMFPIHLVSEPKKGKIGKTWDILKMKQMLGPEICHLLLFAHAIVGCDTTSKPYGLGKGLPLKLLKNNEKFRDFAKVFYEQNTTQKQVDIAGEKAMVIIYGGHVDEGIDSLRFKIFTRKVSTACTFVKPHDIPPTSAALLHHSRRVYLQVQVWIGNGNLEPLHWGWKPTGGMLLPVETDLPPAPADLLNFIKCSCKGSCDSNRCTCRKNQLPCTVACKNCKGLLCTNSPDLDNVDDEDS